MINFRFHLVSLVAVFLALAVGIVVGSTLIDRAIVDALRNRIDTVEANLDDADQVNDELRATNDELDDFVDASAPWAVEGRLPETPVLVLASRGLDGDALDSTVVSLREAGAEVGGVVWFEEAWRLEDDGDQEALATALGRAGGAPDALREEAITAVAAELSSDGIARPVLTNLIDNDFLALETVDGEEASAEQLGGTGTRAVIAVGTDAALPSEDLAALLTQDLVARAVPLTVAEVYKGSHDDPPRGAALAFVRDDDELAAAVSTVDDLEVVPGRVATVLSLADLGEGRVGHYGVGADAQAPLPLPVGDGAPE